MPYIAPDALDALLDHVTDNSDRFVALSAYPTSYAQVATYALGEMAVTGSSFNGPEGMPDGEPGRRIRLQAFSAGTATATGTARYWVLVDDANDIRLAIQRFETPMPIVAGTPWGIVADLPIGLPAWIDDGGEM